MELEARAAQDSTELDRASGEQETKLVEVAVAQPAPHAVGGMVVRLCAGRRSIEVSPGFDDEDLRRLVAVLESC